MGTANAEMSQEELDRIALASLKKVVASQERHATRMRNKRAAAAEKKQALLEKGDDILLCLDCRGGSPEIRSADLVIESRPRHPLVERRDARATGRLVLDPAPTTWDRFGSTVPTQALPCRPHIGVASSDDIHGVHRGVDLTAEEDDGVEAIWRQPVFDGQNHRRGLMEVAMQRHGDFESTPDYRKWLKSWPKMGRTLAWNDDL